VCLPNRVPTAQRTYFTVCLLYSAPTAQCVYRTVCLLHSVPTAQCTYCTVLLPHSVPTAQYTYCSLYVFDHYIRQLTCSMLRVCLCICTAYIPPTSRPTTRSPNSVPTTHLNSCSTDSPFVSVGSQRTQYLTLKSRVLCEKLIVPQLIKLADFHGADTCMTVFTISPHRTLSRATLIQSMLSRPVSSTYILNIFLPSMHRSKIVSFLQVSPPKLRIYFSLHTCHVPRPSNAPLSDVHSK